MQGRRNDGSRSRLPVIAPRHDSESSSFHHPPAPVLSMSSSSSTGEVSRTRLPPRSRSGCWTCRTRKVKCDEQRPTCGQCARLGHICDYSPRLSFRDDTPRVVERMHEVSRTGSHVWDPQASTSEQTSRATDDILPPFADLTSDEDREKKAESVDPGTYHVIANPSSFAALPEYFEDDSDAVAMQEGSRRQSYGDIANLLRREDPEDPNTIILRTFEDPIRRPSVPTLGKQRTSPSSPTPSQASAIHEGRRIAQQGSPHDSPDLAMPRLALTEDRDAQYLQHYRSTISSYVVHLKRTDADEDIFEVQARTFQPLYHAMMALSALSLSRRHRIHNSDALEHYQKVPLTMRDILKTPQDSYSDGALFTHFLLLLYEIAAAGHWEQNMWQSHILQLLRIVTLRHQANGHEPHAFIVWYACAVDTFAVLSHAGTGTFIEGILENNLMPDPIETLALLNRNHPRIIDPDEERYFPGFLQLNQEVILMALQVGKLAQGLRREEVQQNSRETMCSVSEKHAYIMGREQRLQELYNTMRNSFRIWCNRYSDIWTRCGTMPLSRRVQIVCEHAYSLYNACIIYFHTSMYPGQMAHLIPEATAEISICATEILQIAQNNVTQERNELRYIIFPIFLAGFASSNYSDKNRALHLLESLDHYSYGGITSQIKNFLQQVMERQQAGLEAGTGMLSVDWIEDMRRTGLRLVIFGL